MYLPKLQSAYPRQGLALFHFRAAEQDLMQNWLRFFKSLQLTPLAGKLGPFFQIRGSNLPARMASFFQIRSSRPVPPTLGSFFQINHACARMGFVFSNSPFHKIQSSDLASKRKRLRIEVPAAFGFQFKTSIFFFSFRFNTLPKQSHIARTALLRFSYQKG